MKVLVAALAVVLTTPVYALDFFSSSGDRDTSPKKPSLQQRVQLLERRINTISNIVLRLDSLQREMQQLRGDVEVQSNAVEGMKKRQTDFYTDIDQRISRLSGDAPVNRPMQPRTVPSSTGTAASGITQPEMVPSPSEPNWQSSPIAQGGNRPSTTATSPTPTRAGRVQMQPQPTPAPSSLPPVVSSSRTIGGVPGQLSSTSVAVSAPKRRPPTAPRPQSLKGEKSSYQKAFNLLMDRKYDLAQQSFRSFLKRYPGSRLADNAQYWLAEANYVTRKFDAALIEFKKVVKGFPRSDKLSDALLKIGYIQYEKKQWGIARKTLGNLVQRYPNSTASQLAKKRLGKMSAEGH